ncbi:lactase/phlorizin hydrolase-like isoform X2 [Lineus longissimus]|uniref:lactase/phlorizin hydrolase-like isoform X2 n=1 Tax=Lineus longissimus TaxID=88925 RepID=UPI00315CA609
MKTIVLLMMTVAAISATVAPEDDDEILYGTFPEGFAWSTATSAYQIEGGWNAGDKSVNIWDTFTHAGGNVANNATGDIACDSYNKITEDVQLMKNMKVTHYRFSVSWSRLIPTGGRNISTTGLNYYNALIDALIAASIKPVVTLYHWDLPQALQDIGGWENEALVDQFYDYAYMVYSSFGDRVKMWITFNEPFVTCWLGYGIGIHAPGIRQPGEASYKCAHTILKSHAKAWRLYDSTFRSSQNGKCGITLDSDYFQPKDPSNPADVEAAEVAQQFKLGWFANPIFNGDYPEVMREKVYNKSMAQGLSVSRLPTFNQTEIDMIKGTHDFFGLNHYTTRLVTSATSPLNPPSYEMDRDVVESIDPTWPTSGSSWLFGVPWGCRKLLGWIKNTYNDPEIFITENGVSDRNSSMEDTHRVWYYKNYINNVLKAYKIDDVRMIGYTAWSLMDNFEWATGYDEKFGLHYVDFTDPTRPRTPKASAKFYTELIEANGFSNSGQKIHEEL